MRMRTVILIRAGPVQTAVRLSGGSPRCRAGVRPGGLVLAIIRLGCRISFRKCGRDVGCIVRLTLTGWAAGGLDRVSRVYCRFLF